jgi:hypothetical protein
MIVARAYAVFRAAELEGRNRGEPRRVGLGLRIQRQSKLPDYRCVMRRQYNDPLGDTFTKGMSVLTLQSASTGRR